MARAFAFAVVIWTILLVQTVAGFAQQPGNLSPFSAPALKIGSGDLIELNVYDAPDLSGRYRVDEKGEITIPLLGPVHVEGATAEEAGTAIENRYVEAEILKPGNAHANVFIAEYATQGIVVNGAVRNPGLYPALGVRMLNDVISAAGGVLPAAASKVLITRKSDPQNPVTVDYNPDALIPVIPQVQVLPGDSIVVPSAGIVYVLGNVNRPGGFVLNGRGALTVEEAMALAGGDRKAAALNRVQLVRTLEDGRKEDIVIAVNLIQKGKAPDVAMKDGDILYVPTSVGKLATEQFITSALGIGTQITVFKTAY